MTTVIVSSLEVESPNPAGCTGEECVSKTGATAMLAGNVRSLDRSHHRPCRTDQQREWLVPCRVPVALRPPLPLAASSHVRSSFPVSGTLRLAGLLVLAVFFGVFAPGSFALDRSASDHSHSGTRAARLRPLIEEVRFNQKQLTFDQDVTVGPGGGNLEVLFNVPESLPSDHLHLRYRMIGIDADWIDAGKLREASYAALAPGKYTFELEEADTNNSGFPRVVRLAIVVLPHYWQTPWFRTVCAIIFFSIAFILCFLRLRHLEQHAHNLEEEVHQRTAEVQLAKKVAEDAHRALKAQAMKDSLTDLWNRRVIFEMLEKEISRAQREHVPIAVVMIDLDHFKNVNDTYGHLTGDAVLQEVAMRMAEFMRPYDFAGRYGGEEFLIVLPGCSAMNGLQRAEDFRRAIAEKPVPTAFGPLTVTCSLGVASHDGVMPAEDLIHMADEAMYRAKRLGRNCVGAGV